MPATLRDGPADRRPVLEAAGIAKTYHTGFWPRWRQVRVLTDAALTIWPGEVVGLIGENGSGKSMLMKILVGALARDGGTLQRPARLGYCPQEPILYGALSCDEHYDLFGHAYRMAPAAVERARDALYEELSFGRYAHTRVNELSGGTRSKLNLGLALLPDPDLLLLDEPYAGFDWETYQRFWVVVAERKARGRSILIISHFVTDEGRFDRLITLREGRTVEQ
jgi:ABC-type multidrug transport system ATPase subunit